MIMMKRKMQNTWARCSAVAVAAALAGCVGITYNSRPSSGAESVKAVASAPLTLTLANGATFNGVRYDTGEIEGTLSTESFDFRSGQWELPIESGNAARGLLEIKLPDGVIRTESALANFSPSDLGLENTAIELTGGMWLIRSPDPDDPDTSRLVVGPDTQARYEQLRLHLPGQAEAQVLSGRLDQWLQLASAIQKAANGEKPGFIGFVGERRHASFRLNGVDGPLNVSEIRWGLLREPGVNGWSLGVTRRSYQVADSSDLLPDWQASGTAIVGLADGAVLHGQYVNGLVEGTVSIRGPDITGTLEGRYQHGQPVGAFIERDGDGRVVAMMLTGDDGQRLRVPMPSNASACRVIGLPLEAQGRWLAPEGTCSAAGDLEGEIKVAVREDKKYALINVKAQSGQINSGALAPLSREGQRYIEGGFMAAQFSGSVWKGTDLALGNEPAAERLIYQGAFISGRPQGNGICGYAEHFEDCTFEAGQRIDPAHQVRQAAEAEQQRRSQCSQDWDVVSGYAGRVAEYQVNMGACEGRWHELERQAQDTDPDHWSPSRGGLRPFIESVEQCYTDNFTKRSREARAEFEKKISRLRSNQCEGNGATNPERHALDALLGAVDRAASDAQSALGPYQRLDRAGRAAYARQEELRRQQLAADIAQSVRDTFSDWNATQTQIREIGEMAARSNAAVASAQRQARATPALPQQYRPIPPVGGAEHDLGQKMTEICARSSRKAVARNGQWYCESAQTVVYVPWNPTRLCYDPTGTACNTGEPFNPSASDATAGDATGSANGGPFAQDSGASSATTSTAPSRGETTRSSPQAFGGSTSGSNPNGSSLGGNPGKSAMQCISTGPVTSDNKVTFSNQCAYQVFILWCGDLVNTNKQCGDGPSGGFYTQSRNLETGATHTIAVKGAYRYAACEGSIDFGNRRFKDSPDGSFTCMGTNH